MTTKKISSIDKEIIEKLTKFEIYDVLVSRLGRGNKKNQLRKKEDTYYTICPFHQERTPSFLVMPKANGALCLGCGVGFTNPVEFILRYSGQEQLIRELGINEPEIKEYLLEKIKDPIPNMYEIHPENKLELLIQKANLETDPYFIETHAEESLHFRAYMKRFYY